MKTLSAPQTYTLAFPVISIDIWGTLLTPNPDFTRARNKYMAERFTLTDDRVSDARMTTKKLVEQMGISTGKAPSCADVHKMQLILAGEDSSNAEEVMGVYEELFWQHPPLISPDTVDVIRDLMYENRAIVGIASNSNFITGTLVHAFLKECRIWPSFGIYSDLERYAKPSPAFFAKVYQAAYRVANDISKCDTALRGDQIVHIGNDKVLDIGGAIHAGLRARLVSGPDELHAALTAFRGD